MDWTQVKAFLDANRTHADVVAYLAENAKPTKESLAEFAGKPEGLEALQSVFDRERTKAIDGFKTKGMVTELEKAVKKAQEEVESRLKKEYKIEEDPLAKKVRELQEQLASEQNEKKREKLRAKVREKLPEELRDLLSDKLIGDDEDRTNIILGDFQKAFDAHVAKTVDSRIKGGQYQPGKGGTATPGKAYTREEIATISKDPKAWEQHREAILQQTGGTKP